MMQPLLLLKQTLEAPYDPGPLLLNGANAQFTKVEQFLSRQPGGDNDGMFKFGLRVAGYPMCTLSFKRGVTDPVELVSLTLTTPGNTKTYRPTDDHLTVRDLDPMFGKLFGNEVDDFRVQVDRDRCFLTARIYRKDGTNGAGSAHVTEVGLGLDGLRQAIMHVIHVPGLRGNPRRNYPVTAVGERFPGTFDEYVASVIASYPGDEQEFVRAIGDDLAELGLTWKVQAKRFDDTQVELRVGRLSQPARGGARDLVSIADVGFGVSQTLPVVVALRAAMEGQLVYIEQPEIHLHPRAQHAMAKLLDRAAKRGVRVVVETHSSLLLLGIQSLVAEGQLDHDAVKLHWFDRDASTGATRITSADLDDAGRFTAWPVDFDDVSLMAQQAYLDSSERRQAVHGA
jgi:hypothetical protein